MINISCIIYFYSDFDFYSEQAAWKQEKDVLMRMKIFELFSKLNMQHKKENWETFFD